MKKNRRFNGREEPGPRGNSDSQGFPSINTITKTCVFGRLVIHSERRKGEEGITLPIKKEWFLNLGTLSDIEL